jgi:hypothetical protein
VKVQRDGDFIIKSYADDGFGLATRVTLLAEQLRESGLLIPQTWRARDNVSTRQAWIDGPTLRECMRDWFVQGDAEVLVHSDQALVGVMGALRDLHEVCVPVRDLQPHDPFLRIDARIEKSDLRFRSAAARLRECLAARLIELSFGPFLIHGDFHAGQTIFESSTQRWWLIDLDDAAIGAREFDVANFCVHIATSGPRTGAQSFDHMSTILERCLSAYGEPLDPEGLKTFAAAAFLRRGLKLAERGLSDDQVNGVFHSGHLALSS